MLMSFLELRSHSVYAGAYESSAPGLRHDKEESGFGYARINLFLLPVGCIFDESQESRETVV